jgi:hypothetical protein
MTSERCDRDVWRGTIAHEWFTESFVVESRRVHSAMCGGSMKDLVTKWTACANRDAKQQLENSRTEFLSFRQRKKKIASRLCIQVSRILLATVKIWRHTEGRIQPEVFYERITDNSAKKLLSSAGVSIFFLTAASGPCRFTPGTHWIGGWVGARVGLDAVEKGKVLPSRESNQGRPAGSPSLYRLGVEGTVVPKLCLPQYVQWTDDSTRSTRFSGFQNKTHRRKPWSWGDGFSGKLRVYLQWTKDAEI